MVSFYLLVSVCLFSPWTGHTIISFLSTESFSDCPSINIFHSLVTDRHRHAGVVYVTNPLVENSWPQDLDNFSNFSTTAEILVKFNFSCQITSHCGENTAWPVWEISDDVKKGGCGDFSTGDFFGDLSLDILRIWKTIRFVPLSI